MQDKKYVFCFVFPLTSINFATQMSTIIYPSPIFGPVHSRRLGISLGINLQPGDGKVCTFDCLYCECGFNGDHRPHSPRPTREEVRTALERTLIQMHERDEHPDVLTFAGNGEPTTHPDFAGVIDDTIALRDKWAPKARVSVLSNATAIGRPEVREALKRVDNNILKLDTVDNDYIRLLDRPTQPSYDVRRVIEQMKAFEGHCIVQTMLLKGVIDGTDMDNTGDEYILPWLEAVKEIAPSMVMIYTIDRETPDKRLLKATPEEMERVKKIVTDAGIPCTASY